MEPETRSPRMDTEVLVVGAGPTGLVLALWLRRLGVRVRIVDKREGPGETSRALAVQARTLEFYRQIGIVDDVLAAGLHIDRLTIRTPIGVAAALELGEFGEGLSPYAFAFALPQDIHERILIEHLEKAGVRVERQTELVGFADTAGGVTATLRRNGADETVRTSYLCGCDGAHSTVRHGLKLGFPGGAYAQSFYVADVRGSGPVTANGLDVCLGSYGFAIVMPVRQLGSLRLIGVVPKEHEADETITFENIRDAIERDTRINVESVNWFSTYRVHHRVADHFRVGRVFIAGDAGHVHSPAGGQGMNTGIGDAVNLAWKLAAVLHGRADEQLLDSYEAERIAFAHRLIATTDQAFKVATSPSRLVGFWRRHIMPRMMALMLATRAGAHLFFRTVSQIGIQYHASPISSGNAGKIQSGDRLPWVDGPDGDNFAPLASLDWQVHVYGDASEPVRKAMAILGLPLHLFPFSAAAAKAGLAEDALYLVRPDGYVSVCEPKSEVAEIERTFARLRLTTRERLAARFRQAVA